MLASGSLTSSGRSLAFGRPSSAAMKASRIAPVAARRSPLVCMAAAQADPIEEAASTAQVALKEGVCHLRFQRGSPLKVRRVLDVIRGRSYEDAIVMMEYMPYRVCEHIIKALKSAAANAKENAKASKAALVVAEAFADQGPVMKRFTERSQGRAYRINKPTFHLTIRLAERA